MRKSRIGGVLLAAAMAGAVLTACGDNGGQEAFVYNAAPDYYTELYRPQYHLSPETGNMSDPNGMVYFEGEYHQFYQNSGQWGHAVSRDLVHWEHLQPALVRDSLGEIWSGSTVVDWKDTSGFFGGKPGLVAIFTHFKNGLQSQSIAYSSDKGRTWTKYEGNPVIPNPGLKDFRDPKVFWHETTKSWVMVVSVDNHVRFYRSPDLKEWTMSGEFGIGEGSHAAVWECPDLFELPIEGTNRTKWVLTLSIGGNAQTNGSTAQYFIGEFDGQTFHNDNDPTDVLWTDYGKDFYAAVSYSDMPKKDGRRIWLGWMSNWRYPFEMPSEPWNGNMSVPRELRLRDVPGQGLRMVQLPVKELDRLRGKPIAVHDVELAPQDGTDGDNPLAGIRGTSYELDTELELSADARFGLKVRADGEQETVIRYDAQQGELTVDRSRSGDSAFEGGFAESFSGPLKAVDGKLKLRIYVDESTLEVFGGDGETVLSAILFPDATSNGLELYAERGSVKVAQADYYPMKSVWRDEDPSGGKPLRIIIGGRSDSTDVAVGGTSTIKAAVVPLSLPQQLKWSSSDESVAAVAAAGQGSGAAAVVTGIAEGEAEIRAESADGSIVHVINVYVYKP